MAWSMFNAGKDNELFPVGATSLHPQDRERIALVVGAVAAECTEAHPFVEFHGRGVLFVDVDILYAQFGERFSDQCAAYAFAEIVRTEEQHFYLAGPDAHESDAGVTVTCHP